MLMPPIDRYVSYRPWTVQAGASLVEAQDLMRAHQIRHLPVIDDGALVGIVSERDLFLLRAVAGLHETRVREAMSAPVYAIPLGTTLDEVVAQMSEHKYGSAVVQAADGSVVGVFTTVDACRTLYELLQREC